MSEKIKTYSKLSKEEKIGFKPVNKKGNYVEKTAVEDKETAHRLALAENEALGTMEEGIRQAGLSVDEIVAKLSDATLSYDEKSKLQDLLFQHADVERLKGHSIDVHLKEELKKSYISIRHSRVFDDALVKGIGAGDVSAIGEIFKDAMIGNEFSFIGKLRNDEERAQAFEICKERVHAACRIIDATEDVDMALDMYTKTLQLADPKSYSDNSDLSNSGNRLVGKLFNKNAQEQLVELVRSDVFKLSYFKDVMPRMGGTPEVILSLVRGSSEVDAIYYALKFVTDPQLVTRIESEAASFSKLSEKERNDIALYSKELAEALTNEPEIISLSEFEQDKEPEWSGGTKTANNKFVVGVRRGRYTIAWSSMKKNEYHKDLFDKVRGMSAKSGGYIGINEVEGKKVIRMVRSSSDYGYYSKEVLERYRSDIEKALKEALGEQPFELIIKSSTEYEE